MTEYSSDAIIAGSMDNCHHEKSHFDSKFKIISNCHHFYVPNYSVIWFSRKKLSQRIKTIEYREVEMFY